MLLCLAAAVALLGTGTIPAQSDWIDFRESGRFTVRSEFPISRYEVLERAVDSLAAHEADICATLGLPVPTDPVLINLFAERRNFLRAVAATAPEGRGRQALFVPDPADGSSQIFVCLHRDLTTDIRHEATHAVLHSALPFLPLWLDEGLAEYFEVPVADRPSGNPHLPRIRLALRVPFGWRPDLERLERHRDLASLDQPGYRESWAWVHFLLHGPPEAGELFQTYLRDIHEHRVPGPLSVRLRQLYSSPEQALTDHFRTWR